MYLKCGVLQSYRVRSPDGFGAMYIVNDWLGLNSMTSRIAEYSLRMPDLDWARSMQIEACQPRLVGYARVSLTKTARLQTDLLLESKPNINNAMDHFQAATQF